MNKILNFAVAAALFALLLPAQAQENQKSDLSDAEIAQIVVTADTIDINYGKLAVQKAENEEVKAFAETMIRDHSAVNEQAADLAKKLNITPEESEMSRSLKSDSRKKMSELKALDGSDFDKAYIDNEVSYHEAVISALDETLIPDAKNSELKALLEEGRPIFVSHLNHAKEIQKSLK